MGNIVLIYFIDSLLNFIHYFLGLIPNYLIGYIIESIFYLPAFYIAFKIYYWDKRSIWKANLLSCLALANGVGSASLVIVGALIFKVVQPDLVTIASIVIIVLEAFTAGKFYYQKPKTRRKIQNTKPKASSSALQPHQ